MTPTPNTSAPIVKLTSSTQKVCTVWTKELPCESGLYWWWNEDEDSCPIPVNIAYSGTDGSYFATAGQHGWNYFQRVGEMAGFWSRLLEPELPTGIEPEKDLPETACTCAEINISHCPEHGTHIPWPEHERIVGTTPASSGKTLGDDQELPAWLNSDMDALSLKLCVRAENIELLRLNAKQGERIAELEGYIGRLSDKIDDWKAATNLQDSSGDPDGVEPHNLEAAIEADRVERIALETLSKQLAEALERLSCHYGGQLLTNKEKEALAAFRSEKTS